MGQPERIPGGCLEGSHPGTRPVNDLVSSSAKPWGTNPPHGTYKPQSLGSEMILVSSSAKPRGKSTFQRRETSVAPPRFRYSFPPPPSRLESPLSSGYETSVASPRFRYSFPPPPSRMDHFTLVHTAFLFFASNRRQAGPLFFAPSRIYRTSPETRFFRANIPIPSSGDCDTRAIWFDAVPRKTSRPIDRQIPHTTCGGAGQAVPPRRCRGRRHR